MSFDQSCWNKNLLKSQNFFFVQKNIFLTFFPTGKGSFDIFWHKIVLGRRKKTKIECQVFFFVSEVQEIESFWGKFFSDGILRMTGQKVFEPMPPRREGGDRLRFEKQIITKSFSPSSLLFCVTCVIVWVPTHIMPSYKSPLSLSLSLSLFIFPFKSVTGMELKSRDGEGRRKIGRDISSSSIASKKKSSSVQFRTKLRHLLLLQPPTL